MGGILEPPTTPIGRDEVALRRHRFFSDLISAAKAATEHRVCFDPLGPFVTEVLPFEALNEGLHFVVFFQSCQLLYLKINKCMD